MIGRASRGDVPVASSAEDDIGQVAGLPRSRIACQLALSAAALLWERGWPAMWPAVGVAGLFVAIGLFGIWGVVPWWLHLGLLAGFAGALAWSLWRARGALRVPRRIETIRRLERTSGIAHRPLSTLLDEPATAGGPESRALWQQHQGRAAKLVRLLRVGWPAAGLAQSDPHGLRAALVLLLVIGFATAGDQAGTRIAQALEPDFAGLAGARWGRLTAWIDPPDYTHLAPVFLSGSGQGEPVAAGAEAQAVPAGAIEVVGGSVLAARISGGRSVPLLKRDHGEARFEAVGDDNYTIEVAVEGGGALEIVQGRHSFGRWQLAVRADTAPTVALPSAPDQTTRGVLHLAYQAEDDFGLAQVSARIHRRDQGGDVAPIELALPLPGLEPLSVRDSTYRDLTPHPWAGLPVILELSALDNAGQTGRAPEFPMVLPERPFDHPVAKAIVEQRRRLALDRTTRVDVRQRIRMIGEAPEAFGDDVVAYLGLRVVYERLRRPQDEASEQGVLDLMWDLALRIEDGTLSIAERELRAAQQALQDALEGDATPEELSALMDQLQAALEKYLEALSESGKDLADQRDDRQYAESEMVQRSAQDFRRMLDQARDMAMTGAREQAQEMLRRMQEMLENLEVGRAATQPAQGPAEELMKQLEQIMTDQDQLLDDTFQRAISRGENEREAPGRGETGADRQEALRRALGDVMRQVGEAGAEIPEGLGRAERLMRDSREELERDRADRAIDPQAQALQALQQGAQQLLNRQMAGQAGERPGGRDGRQPFDENRDPLGRLPPGNTGDPRGYVEVPKQSDIERSREILNELYRRAGQPQRPQTERDYIDRLLRWY